MFVLQDKTEQRKSDLEDSLQAQQYFADANEAESWMREKEPIVGNMDYGKDEDSAEALLKKHEAMMSDVEQYRVNIDSLKEQAASCKVCSNSCTRVIMSNNKACSCSMQNAREDSLLRMFQVV